MSWRGQAVFDTHGGADFIEGVLATGLFVFCREAVGELRTVVGQQFDDPDRRGQLEPSHEPAEAKVPFTCALYHPPQGRGISRSDSSSSLDQPATTSRARRLAGRLGSCWLQRLNQRPQVVRKKCFGHGPALENDVR
jgi:hypothetical protein